MRFSLSSAGLQEWNGDVLAVGLPQGDVDATATALEQRFAGITDALKQQKFKGKPGDQLVITPLGGGPQRLVVLGLGESDAIDTERLRGAAARAAKAAIGCEGSLGLQLPWSACKMYPRSPQAPYTARRPGTECENLSRPKFSPTYAAPKYRVRRQIWPSQPSSGPDFEGGIPSYKKVD